MSEELWQPARLIPTSGIAGQEEAERRATSALLAVMSSVREFGSAIVKPFGAPGGAISTYIEVPFKLGERKCIPDGLVRARRAGRDWTALVEVKTGLSELTTEQVEDYLDVARDHDFQLVLTISNQLAPAPGIHPVTVDRRKLRKVELRHLSWAEVLTIAVQQRVHRGVADPDQAWILGELIRYLEHPRSGALDFSEMGASWVPIREAIEAGTLRSSDKGIDDVASRWEQLLRFAALRLGRELGAEVQVTASRKELVDPALRIAAQTQSLVSDGELTGSLRVPGAVAPIDMTANLRTGRLTLAIDLEAPREGRPATRVNWLTRQLREAPAELRVDAFVSGSRGSMSELLKSVREDPRVLVDDAKREIRRFTLTASSPIGLKRATGRGSFIDSVLTALDGFYASVVQHLRPWAQRPPQLPEGEEAAGEQAGLDLRVPELDLASTDATYEEANDGDSDDTSVPGGVPGVDFDREEHSVASVPGVVPDDRELERDEIVSWEVFQDRLDRERQPEDETSLISTRAESNDQSQGIEFPADISTPV